MQEAKLALRQRLEECTKQLQSNSEMIRWLNDNVCPFVHDIDSDTMSAAGKKTRDEKLNTEMSPPDKQV